MTNNLRDSLSWKENIGFPSMPIFQIFFLVKPSSSTGMSLKKYRETTCAIVRLTVGFRADSEYSIRQVRLLWTGHSDYDYNYVKWTAALYMGQGTLSIEKMFTNQRFSFYFLIHLGQLRRDLDACDVLVPSLWNPII